MDNKDQQLREKILETIQSGGVVMRPKWHFVLKAGLLATGTVLVFLTLLYMVTLSVFLLHQNGAWFAPGFGARGWLELFRSLPWMLLLVAGVFVVILEVLVRRYTFAYRKPLWYSVIAILVVVSFGGILLAGVPTHRRPFPKPVQRFFGPPKPERVHHVEVLAGGVNTLIVRDLVTGTTSTIIIGPNTRMYPEIEFAPGDLLVVFGDRASGTIRAIGIQEVRE